LTGINFVTTILKMRARHGPYARLPSLDGARLEPDDRRGISGLTATFAMLLDRYLGFHFSRSMPAATR
jgi:cytochrome o ubiquinol oxidase subunit 1